MAFFAVDTCDVLSRGAGVNRARHGEADAHEARVSLWCAESPLVYGSRAEWLAPVSQREMKERQQQQQPHDLHQQPGWQSEPGSPVQDAATAARLKRDEHRDHQHERRLRDSFPLEEVDPRALLALERDIVVQSAREVRSGRSQGCARLAAVGKVGMRASKQSRR